MNVAITSIEYIILPSYKKKLAEKDIKDIETFLSYSESIIRLTESQPLPRDSIDKLISILGKTFRGRLYPGGKDALFAWGFKCKSKKILIKPYYSQVLASLVLHHLAVEEFGSKIRTSIKKTKVNITIPDVVGIGKIFTPTLERDSIPVLITTESNGKKLDNYPAKKRLVPKICSALSRQGYMIDKNESNWRILPKSGNNFEYIELLNSKKITNLNKKISKLIGEINESGKMF